MHIFYELRYINRELLNFLPITTGVMKCFWSVELLLDVITAIAIAVTATDDYILLH